MSPPSVLQKTSRRPRCHFQVKKLPIMQSIAPYFCQLPSKQQPGRCQERYCAMRFTCTWLINPTPNSVTYDQISPSIGSNFLWVSPCRPTRRLELRRKSFHIATLVYTFDTGWLEFQWGASCACRDWEEQLFDNWCEPEKCPIHLSPATVLTRRWLTRWLTFDRFCYLIWSTNDY